MGIRQIIELVNGMNKTNPNEDCSECAERVASLLRGNSKIITIVAYNKDNDRLCEFKTSFSSQLWKYHVVVMFAENGTEYIVDITESEKVRTLADYMDNLANVNCKDVLNGVIFALIDGDVGEKALSSVYFKSLRQMAILGTHPKGRIDVRL